MRVEMTVNAVSNRLNHCPCAQNRFFSILIKQHQLYVGLARLFKLFSNWKLKTKSIRAALIGCGMRLTFWWHAVSNHSIKNDQKLDIINNKSDSYENAVRCHFAKPYFFRIIHLVNAPHSIAFIIIIFDFANCCFVYGPYPYAATTTTTILYICINIFLNALENSLKFWSFFLAWNTRNISKNTDVVVSTFLVFRYISIFARFYNRLTHDYFTSAIYLSVILFCFRSLLCVCCCLLLICFFHSSDWWLAREDQTALCSMRVGKILKWKCSVNKIGDKNETVRNSVNVVGLRYVQSVSFYLPL